MVLKCPKYEQKQVDKANNNMPLLQMWLIMAFLRRKQEQAGLFMEPVNIRLIRAEECRRMTRFYPKDLEAVRIKLGIPNRLKTSTGCVCRGYEGLLITMLRFSYPSRWEDIKRQLGIGVSKMKSIFYHVLRLVDDRWKHLLKIDWHRVRPQLQRFADAIFAMAPTEYCWGFIDGTIRPICRPTYWQRVAYSGHKRFHGIKFQSILTPDGLIVHMFGPIEGRRHDSHMLRLSALLLELQQFSRDDNGAIFYIYGDPAYPLSEYLMCGFKPAVTPEEMEFNTKMSTVRESVEWGFQKVQMLWGYVDFRRKMKVFQVPVSTLYTTATLFTNIHTCLYGAQTSQYFNLDPPTLDQYLTPPRAQPPPPPPPAHN